MATQEDRSLSAGVSLPQWMKSRITDKFDFDQSAFSPTELDDSFMYYYRHPTNRNTENSIASNQSANSTVVCSVSQGDNSTNSDFSRHTAPCQKYLKNNNDVSFTQPMKTPQSMKIKSNGTDDGFKSDAAKCGSSVIRVAHQMVADKVITFHPTIREHDDEDCDQIAPQMDKFDPHRRRGSKSLPASPLTSPNASPKLNRRGVNKYFTGAFVDTDKNKGWILSNLLARREISQSVGFIHEEEPKEEIERASSTISMDDMSASRKQQAFKAKPSELREMNFWSPTSM